MSSLYFRKEEKDGKEEKEKQAWNSLKNARKHPSR